MQMGVVNKEIRSARGSHSRVLCSEECGKAHLKVALAKARRLVQLCTTSCMLLHPGMGPCLQQVGVHAVLASPAPHRLHGYHRSPVALQRAVADGQEGEQVEQPCHHHLQARGAAHSATEAQHMVSM